MKDAIELASVKLEILQSDQQTWELWSAMLKRMGTLICRRVYGIDKLQFEQTPAPVHERAGRA